MSSFHGKKSFSNSGHGRLLFVIILNFTLVSVFLLLNKIYVILMIGPESCMLCSPLTTLRDNLVIALVDTEENEIAHTGSSFLYSQIFLHFLFLIDCR